MKADVLNLLVEFGLLFCRVGACVMLLPGLSSERVSAFHRLFLALAISLAILPIASAKANGESASETPLLMSIVGEVIVGSVTGMLVRVFYLALEFAAATAANCAGYGSIFHQSIEDGPMSGPFSELLTLSAIVLFFTMDLHLSIILMLAEASAASPGGTITTASVLNWFTAALKSAFTLALVLNAPLLTFSIALNVGFGLLNRLTPQIPIYFFSVPFAMAGGIFIFYQSNSAMLRVFLSEVADWIGRMPGHG